MEHLTKETFKEKVFNFEENKEWKFKGDKPSVIKFGAEWCSPCKSLEPLLEELNNEYGSKINIYDIDVDEEFELAGMFGVQSIPSILFIPMDEQPQMSMGALSKDTFVKAFNDVLKVD